MKYAPGSFWPWGIVFWYSQSLESLILMSFWGFKFWKLPKNMIFLKMSKNNLATCYPMWKNAAKTAILSVLSQTFQNDMFLSKYIFYSFNNSGDERITINSPSRNNLWFVEYDFHDLAFSVRGELNHEALQTKVLNAIINH